MAEVIAREEQRGGTVGASAAAGALWGLVAGVVFAAATMMWAAFVWGDTLWAPMRMIATMVGFEPGQAFSMLPVLSGMMIHLALSALYGVVFAVAMRALAPVATGITLLAGALYGLAIYVVNFHGFAQLEAFSAFRTVAGDPFEIAIHVLFGLVLAGGLARRFDGPAQSRT